MFQAKFFQLQTSKQDAAAVPWITGKLAILFGFPQGNKFPGSGDCDLL
jgi:hypothetical protein